jgi:hypothetical protein
MILVVVSKRAVGIAPFPAFWEDSAVPLSLFLNIRDRSRAIEGPMFFQDRRV